MKGIAHFLSGIAAAPFTEDLLQKSGQVDAWDYTLPAYHVNLRA